jgi:hypothetical protein
MKIVAIPGGTASLREAEDIKVRQRQLVESAYVPALAAMAKLPTSSEELEAFDVNNATLTRQETASLFELQNATIIAALESWSLPDPIPNMDTIGDLDQDVFDALSEATASLAGEVVADTSFEPTDPRGSGFEETPTSPSDDSAVVLRADQAPARTSAPESDTASTVIDGYFQG